MRAVSEAALPTAESYPLEEIGSVIMARLKGP